MPRPKNRVPSLLIHKKSGLAYCRPTGQKPIYFGPANTAEASRLYAEWSALYQGTGGAIAPRTVPTITELAIWAMTDAERRYRRSDGSKTHGEDLIRLTLKRLRFLFGGMAANRFGPAELVALREACVREGKKRSTCNKIIHTVRLIFKRAAEAGYVPASTWHALGVVEGVPLNRADVTPDGKVTAASAADVEKTIEHVAPPVAALIRIQMNTGARGDELLRLRPMDINQSDSAIWIYSPKQHKTAHHGHVRTIAFGPETQAILNPFLLRNAESFCFSPAEANRYWRERRTLNRKTKPQWGNGPGTNLKKNPKRKPGERFTAATYAQAIRRACIKAEVPVWTPHRLRHWKATTMAEQGFSPIEIAAQLGNAPDLAEGTYVHRDTVKTLKRLAQ